MNHNKNLIISAAEAGDFGEWTSDQGVQLNFALESILQQAGGHDEKAYDRTLKLMPKLALDFQETGGANYKDLCEDGFKALENDWKYVVDKTVEVSKAYPSSSIVILNESSIGLSTLSSPALYTVP